MQKVTLGRLVFSKSKLPRMSEQEGKWRKLNVKEKREIRSTTEAVAA